MHVQIHGRLDVDQFWPTGVVRRRHLYPPGRARAGSCASGLAVATKLALDDPRSRDGSTGCSAAARSPCGSRVSTRRSSTVRGSSRGDRSASRSRSMRQPLSARTSARGFRRSGFSIASSTDQVRAFEMLSRALAVSLDRLAFTAEAHLSRSITGSRRADGRCRRSTTRSARQIWTPSASAPSMRASAVVACGRATTIASRTRSSSSPARVSSFRSSFGARRFGARLVRRIRTTNG